MKFSFEINANATPKKIWHFYEDIHNWIAWEDDLKDISLNGEFATGSTGVMTLEGMPSMEFTLTNVVSNEIFMDKTTIKGVGEIYFIHELDTDNGVTTVRHYVEFISENGNDTLKDAQFIKQVFSDVPTSVIKLVEVSYDCI